MTWTVYGSYVNLSKISLSPLYLEFFNMFERKWYRKHVRYEQRIQHSTFSPRKEVTKTPQKIG